MRRLACLFAIMILLTLPVSALNSITSANNQTTINTDGSCQVSLALTLKLDYMPAGLVFPIPAEATNVTVGGVSVSAPYSGGVRKIDLSGFIANAGTHTFVIRYTLPDAISKEKDNLILTLPLLCGFEYPVEAFYFTINLPGHISGRPQFTSTYYPDAIETMMYVRVQNETITGSMDNRLQDHETLTMSLVVTEEMFPQPVAKQWSMDTTDLVMLSFAGAAILYWLITMRALPPRSVRRSAAPDGITAGHISCRLIGQGVDFTAMVLSWAQLGYILIQPDDDGRVLLHKRMEMGNERSEYENRAFRGLFGKRTIVNGTGYHYAVACRKAIRSIPGIQDDFRRGSGNPLIFRSLALIVGAVNGVSMAIAFAEDSGWRAVLGILLAIAGLVVTWFIQGIGKSIHSRNKLHAIVGIVAAGLWYLLNHLSGEWILALIVIPFEFLTGLGAFYGGRRTESGKQVVSEILGLRHYLKSLNTKQWKQILRNNPHYFYDMAPYALALGIDRQFARQLKGMRLPNCPYLTTGMDGQLTAAEWNQLLRETISRLDALQRRLPLDRLLGR